MIGGLHSATDGLKGTHTDQKHTSQMAFIVRGNFTKFCPQASEHLACITDLTDQAFCSSLLLFFFLDSP